jgi:hypothetical protein
MDRLAEPRKSLRQRIESLPDAAGIVAGNSLAQGRHGVFHGLALGVAHSAAVLLKLLLGFVDRRIRLVARLDELAPALVLGRVLLGLAAPCAGCRPRKGRPTPGCGSAAPCPSPCPWRTR